MNSREALVAEYLSLQKYNDDTGKPWQQKRGYIFEKLLNRLLAFDDLQPRTSYKAIGEQIDGSFFLDGSTFLLEAKWHAQPVPASTLYQFKGKIDGKLVGTIGVFISMSGYSEDAIDALTLGKSLNLLLFDRHDMEIAITKQFGFKELLRRRLRLAAEEGLVYFNTEADLVDSAGSRPVNLGEETIAEEEFLAHTKSSEEIVDLIVVCEGKVDRSILRAFAKRIILARRLQRSIVIIPAMGVRQLPKVANAVRALLSPSVSVLLVADDDDLTEDVLQMLKLEESFGDWLLSTPTPDILAWLGMTHDNRTDRWSAGEKFEQAIAKIDLDELRQRDRSFALFYKAVVGN